jgi:hypothetical protein
MATVFDEAFAGGALVRVHDASNIPRTETKGGGWVLPVLVWAIGWLPLALLVRVESYPSSDRLESFLGDGAVHYRAFIAAPVLALARVLSLPQLLATCAHFQSARLIRETDQRRFYRVLASTWRLDAAPWAVFASMLLAYAIVFSLVTLHPTVPAWQMDVRGDSVSWSLAGLWHALVTVPVLLILLLCWLWRALLWVRFLWCMSRLELNLTATHPDGVGGLRFVSDAVRSFAAVGLALGALVAKSLGEVAARHGTAPGEPRNVALETVAFVLVMFAGPSLVFVPALLSARRRGIHQYGSIASHLGFRVEHQWSCAQEARDPTLAIRPASACDDLSQRVGNVYRMSVIPMDLQSLLLLSVATALPFIVATSSTVSSDMVVAFVSAVLF